MPPSSAPAIAKASPLSLFATPLFASELVPAERAAAAAALQGQPAGQDLARLPALAPLARLIEGLAEQVLEELKVEQRGARLAHLWLEALAPGAAGALLAHPNAYLGGLYRLEGEAPAGAIFNDPRSQAHLLQAPLAAPGPLTAPEQGLPLPAGRLLLFPAWLRHQPAAAEAPRRLLRFAVSFRRYAERLAPPRWTGMSLGRD